jgi:hypothetical protein
MLEQIELIVIVVMLFACYSAWKSNRRSDASWERMRRELTPTTYLGMAGEWKAYYSRQLVGRLSSVLNHAASHDNGYYHTLIHPIDLTPGSVNYVSDLWRDGLRVFQGDSHGAGLLK